jgi:DUF3037 family protein
MPAGSEFQYSILRVVPSLERGERINVGVVLFCRQLAFLAARAEVNHARLLALAPATDPQQVGGALEAICDVVEGRPDAGPLASLTQSNRFGWVTAPSSTIIQPSRVHTGLTEDPKATLERLFDTLVLDA